MAERRSLSNAFRQTPEVSLDDRAIAFIKGGVPGRGPVAEEQKAAEPKTIELSQVESEPVAAAEPIQARAVQDSKEPRQRRVRVREPQPTASKVFVSVTTRLEQPTANALRRAYLEQKLKGMSPATQQEIIEISVQAWLRDNGYLDS